MDQKGRTEGRHQSVQRRRRLPSAVQDLSNQWERVQERITLGTSRLLNSRPSSNLDHDRVTGATQSPKMGPSKNRRFPAHNSRKGSKSSSVLAANSDQGRRSEATQSQTPDQKEKRLLPSRCRKKGSKSTPLLDAESQEQDLPATRVEPNINSSSSHSQDRVFHDSLQSRVEDSSSSFTKERGNWCRSKCTKAFVLDDTFPLNFGTHQDARDTQSDKGLSPAQAITFLLKQPKP